MNWKLAASARDVSELFADPALTVACVMLITVSLGWIVVSRVIARMLKKAAIRGHRRLETIQDPRDIWSYPP